MSDDCGFSSGFKQILQKLEDEHHREISHLRAEFAKEILQMRTEHGRQSAVQVLSTSSQMEVSPEYRMPAGKSLSASFCESRSLRSSLRSRGSIFVQEALSSLKQKVRRPSSEPSEIERSSSVLRDHVAKHLEKPGMNNFMNKYAAAHGWKQTPRSQRKVEPETRVQRLVANHHFDTLCASAIVLNTVLLGAIASFHASRLGTADLPVHYLISNNVFSCWFLLELVLRWRAEGFFVFFLRSPHLNWNLFDIFVVGTDIIEHVIVWTTGGEGNALGNLTAMRMMRVLRIARALRVVRLMRFCKELRVMVLSLMRSGLMLVWSLILMSLVFFIFSILFMQSVTAWLTERLEESGTVFQHESRFPKDSTEAKLDNYFGSLSMTFYMLFQTVSGGISWGELTALLSEVNVAITVIFCFFVFFSYFAMLNIITGFFVQAAMEAVKTDENEVIQEEMNSENSLMRQLQELFAEADTDGSGGLVEEEFSALVEKPRAHALMKSLGLQVSEARGLFALLDLDTSGEVSIDDFIIGCMRLRGGAQELDLIKQMYDIRKLMQSQLEMSQLVQTEFDHLRAFESSVEDRLKELASLPNLLAERHTSSAFSLPPKMQF